MHLFLMHLFLVQGLLTWREFDKRYFSQPRGERPGLIAKDKVTTKTA